ncbi:hypothetical protein Landi51_13847 [Colletotrichum acutatum]
MMALPSGCSRCEESIKTWLADVVANDDPDNPNDLAAPVAASQTGPAIHAGVHFNTDHHRIISDISPKPIIHNTLTCNRASHGRKRGLPLTPTSSDKMASPIKRQRASASSTSSDGSVIDLQELTPRPVKSHRSDPRPGRLTRASSTRSGASSSRASPKKHLAYRQYKTAPITVRQYWPNEESVPCSLHEMWGKLARFNKGANVISMRKKAEIDAAADSLLRRQTIERWYYDDAPARDDIGESPSVAQVMSILENARFCSDEGYCEASWNQVVHGEVLQLAVPLLARGSEGKVSYIPCPTAKIIDCYVDTRGSSRKVDYCMLINPEAPFASAIQELQYRDDLSSQSINHTSYQPLRRRPIGLSIETKGHDEGLIDAKTQLLIWFEAQWEVLERLAKQNEPPQPLPEFLPGVIVEGHKWYFVASTRNGTETILWMKQELGTTEEAIGVYSVVCALQYLARWVQTVYWPTFQRYLVPPQTSITTG